MIPDRIPRAYQSCYQTPPEQGMRPPASGSVATPRPQPTRHRLTARRRSRPRPAPRCADRNVNRAAKPEPRRPSSRPDPSPVTERCLSAGARAAATQRCPLARATPSPRCRVWHGTLPSRGGRAEGRPGQPGREERVSLPSRPFPLAQSPSLPGWDEAADATTDTLRIAAVVRASVIRRRPRSDAGAGLGSGDSGAESDCGEHRGPDRARDLMRIGVLDSAAARPPTARGLLDGRGREPQTGEGRRVAP